VEAFPRFIFLERGLDALADAFGSLAVEPACKHRDDGEQILHQFLARFQLLGRVQQFQPNPIQLKASSR
jgi:hypothetical protein